MTTFADAGTLVARRHTILNNAESILRTAQLDGRDSLTPAEDIRYRAMVADARDLDQDIERRAQISDRLGRLQRPVGGAVVTDQALTYRRNDPRTSYVRDLLRYSLNLDDTGESRGRLAQHAREVAEAPEYMQHRDLSRAEGQGGWAVPPAWLIDQYVELARPGRPFADLIPTRPLPAGTDSINIPKVLTGTAVGVQVADNTSIVEVDLTDTFINAPVRTIAGAQGVSIQLIDQSPIAFDDVIFRDMVAAHAAATDTQCLSGTGVNGQILGVDSTVGIQTIAVSSVDIVGFYKAVAHAISLIHMSRFLPPDVLLLSPRRWSWILSLLDTTQRPLVIPSAQNPMNSAGVQQGVVSQGVVGQMCGLSVVADPNIGINQGYSTTEDAAYVLRSTDPVLWESGIRARVLPESRAETLTILLQIYSYLAASFARYPMSIVKLTGLSAPTW